LKVNSNHTLMSNFHRSLFFEQLESAVVMLQSISGAGEGESNFHGQNLLCGDVGSIKTE
jgi:hypothetical protein